ncbi:phage holin family protein [Candidatus Uhrbacteria bacterium]|jgi:putative membrane protein|nr:phage holin family protein [Candidatus Uhrbacteria bacterium]
MKTLLRWVINALALLVLTQVVPGFAIDTFYHALIAALVLGLLNAIVRPVAIILTLPINIVTLGLFTFVINAGLIWFMSTFIKGVEVTDFWAAILVAIVLWAVATITNFFLKHTKESK